MTLTEFLTARLDDDAAAFHSAVAAEVERCRHDGMPDTTHAEVEAYWLRRENGAAVTEWPRWLAEVEAKRRIVEYHYSWSLEAERNPKEPFGPIFKAKVIAAESVLRALALPYADHPDYRPEWRP